MTKREITTLSRQIKRLEMKRKEIEKDIDKKKSQLKSEFESRGVEVLESYEHIIRWPEISSHVFDLTRFKEDHPKLYSMYLSEQHTRRFTIA